MFIDTGAFIARYLRRDEHHAAATAGWVKLLRAGRQVVTSDMVVAEAINFLAQRTDGPFAAKAGFAILTLPLLRIARPAKDDETAALELMGRFEDQAFSFTDCVSFVLMKRAKIKRAFTFDADFAIAGFDAWPGK